jgi:hypothetical protein
MSGNYKLGIMLYRTQRSNENRPSPSPYSYRVIPIGCLNVTFHTPQPPRIKVPPYIPPRTKVHPYIPPGIRGA